MARIFDVNNAQTSGDYAGPWLYALINHLVAVGWVVVGSGDGDALYQYVGVTAGPYNVFTGATVRNNATTLIAGDAGNRRAWVVLENDARQVLFQQTDNATGWAGYGICIYNPGLGSTPAFTSAGVNATTPPGAATCEVSLVGGSRASLSTGILVPYNTTGYYHFWGDDTPAEGGALSWGYAFITSSGTTLSKYIAVCGVDVGSSSAADADPVMVFVGSGPAGAGNCWAGWGWNPLVVSIFGGDMQAIAPAAFGLNTPAAGGGDAVGGEDQIVQMLGGMGTTAGTRFIKGLLTTGGLASGTVARAWGNWGEDAASLGWAYVGGGVLMPWPDSATTPLP